MAKPFIIAADEIKEYFPHYSEKKSSEFHRESAKLADSIFSNTVKIIPQSIVLLGGGTASGKTEYLSQYIIKFGKKGGIFFDGTLPRFEGAKIKVKHAIQYERNIEIHYIFPRTISESFTVFLNRSRQFDPEHFYKTHSSSRKTILETAKHFPGIKIRLIESSFTHNSDTMNFREVEFASRHEQIEFLKDFQYNEQEIISKTL